MHSNNTREKLLAQRFKSLADPSRVSILEYIQYESAFCDLDEEPVQALNCSLRICDWINLSEPTMSYHTTLLEKSGFITRLRYGKYFYFFVPENVRQILQLLGLVLPEPKLLKQEVFSFNQSLNENTLAEFVEFAALHNYFPEKPAQKGKTILRYYFRKNTEKNSTLLLLEANLKKQNLKIEFLADSDGYVEKQISKLLDLSKKYFRV